MRMILPAKFLLACTVSLLLAACGERTGPGAPATAIDPARETPVTAAPPPGATDASPPSAPAPADGEARFDGYGDLRFGMTAAEAGTAWAGELTRHGGEGEPCYHLAPKWVKVPAEFAKVPAEFALMIEDDRFVRYSSESDRYTAPGGGKVGMSTAQIEALYPGRIERLPHKYSDGQYLRIKDSADATRAVLFETDARGVVTEWRAGVVPQVDYVEGCS